MRKWMKLNFMTKKDEQTGMMQSPDGKRKVFISYSVRDNEQLNMRNQIAGKILEIVDCAVWYDEYGLHGGENFEEEIHEAICQCDAMVLIVTPGILDSPFIRDKEIKTAREQGKPIIPIVYYIGDAGMEEIKNLIGENIQALVYSSKDFDRKLYNTIKRFVIDSTEAQRIERLFLSGSHEHYGTLTLEDRVLIATGYLYGIGTGKDEEKGEKLLEYISNDPGEDEMTLRAVSLAHKKIGLYNYYKEGLSFEESSAIEHLSKVNDPNDEEVLSVLGLVYLFGAGADADQQKGFDYTRRAAEAGNSMSMLAMGDAYESGLWGQAVDHELALKWYQKAAEAGRSDAMLRLYYYYKNDKALDPDGSKAEKMYQRAYKAGVAETMLNQNNYEAAISVYLDALIDMVEKTDGDAGLVKLFENFVNMLGGLSESGGPNEAANGSAYAEGLCALADMLCCDEMQNYPRAMELYAQAAEQGSAEAMCSLGDMYYFAMGVEVNYAKAAELYQKAAALGYAEAMFNLGSMYHEGVHYVKDEQKADEWFRKAEENGYQYESEDELDEELSAEIAMPTEQAAEQIRPAAVAEDNDNAAKTPSAPLTRKEQRALKKQQKEDEKRRRKEEKARIKEEKRLARRGGRG